MEGRYTIASLIVLGAVGYVLYDLWKNGLIGSPADAASGLLPDSLGGSTVDTTNSNAEYSYPQTRGFRNNNPGNLRYIHLFPYNGQTGDDGGGYGVYSSMQLGVRAAWHQLDKDVSSLGDTTLTALINSWAPSNENDTAAYIADMSTRTGLDPVNDQINAGEYPAILDAIFVHENGSNPIPQDVISTWGQS